MPPKTAPRPPRDDVERRRVEVRLTPREYDALDDAARMYARSLSGQARTLIVQGLALAVDHRQERRG